SILRTLYTRSAEGTSPSQTASIVRRLSSHPPLGGIAASGYRERGFSMLRRVGIWSGALLAAACVALPASAQSGRKFGELLKRVPDQGNALLLIDVDGLFQSKYGQRERWKERAMSRATEGLGLAHDVAKVAVAANFDLNNLNENWKLGLAEVRDTLPDLA